MKEAHINSEENQTQKEKEKEREILQQINLEEILPNSKNVPICTNYAIKSQ